MRTTVTILMISITLAGCSNETETRTQAPAKEANTTEATPSQKDQMPAAEPRAPLDLSMPEGITTEDWEYDESYTQSKNQLEIKKLFKQDKDDDPLSISVSPSINFNEDLNELELEGGSINVEVKTE
jgi:PBP1b-binding outer membrane lipoprotein LpoB